MYNKKIKPIIKVAKGKVEHTVDKVMMITLIFCIFLIILLLGTSYSIYSNHMEDFINGNIDNTNENQSSFAPLVSEEGYILIDGNQFIPKKEADEYSVTDFAKLGAAVLNRNLINIGKQDASVFYYKNTVWIICGILFIYWLILLFLYEKEKRLNFTNYNISSDEDLFKRYPPLIAGCLEGNRNVVYSDIIATIFGLVNKKIITLELEPINNEKTFYKYNLIRNKKMEVEIGMDEIEIYVHQLLFGTSGFSKDKTDLKTFIEEFSENKDSTLKLKQLQKLASKKLHSIGANKNNTPFIFRLTNIGIFTIALAFFLFIIWSSIVSIKIGSLDMILVYFAIMLFGFLMPLIIFAIYAGVLVFMQGKLIMNKLVEKVSKRDVIIMSLLVIGTLTTVVLFTWHSSITPALIPYEIMLGLSFLIMKTDNLMLQNDEEILLDYDNLKRLKEKIKDYSLLDKREVEDIKLWEHYMTYAIAFGIAKKVIHNTDTEFQTISTEKSYLLDLALDTAKAFIEVNFN